MDRVIEFRGKHNGKEWVFGFLYRDDTGSYIKESAKNMRFGCGIPVHIETVGQFIGLHDSNNSKLWEGDVVRFGSAIGVIIWHFDGWQIRWISVNDGLKNSHDQYSTKITPKKLSHSKKLGNIYDNPEYAELFTINSL